MGPFFWHNSQDIVSADILFHFRCLDAWVAWVSSELTSHIGISTESPVCRGALQLHQVISPCERCCWLSCIPTTPGHLVQDGPSEKMHGNTVQIFPVFIPQSNKTSLPSLNNSSIFEQNTSLNRPKLTCFANFIFMHFINIININNSCMDSK